MNRKIVLISSGLLPGVTTLVILTFFGGGSKVTVSYVNSEPSHGEFPSYAMSERLAFAVRNAGSKRASVDVCEMEDEHGNRVPLLRGLGDVEAGQITQLYLYLPAGSHPRGLRMRVLESACLLQKTQFALRMLIKKASGRYPSHYPSGQVWFDRLKAVSGEIIVVLDKEAERKKTASTE